MFKIGDFSKICQVTRQTLRHWDAVDLLKPAIVDEANGYRYYTVEQIPTVNRILSLQLLGLKLTEICVLLETAPSEADLREMFAKKIRELDGKIEQYRIQRDMLEVRLQNVDLDKPLSLEIVLKDPIPVTVMTYRKTFADLNEMSNAIIEMYAQQRANESVCLSISHVSAIEEADLDVEIGLQLLKENITLHLNLERRTIRDGEQVVTTIFGGSWVHGVAVYNQVGRWIDAHGYQLNGAWREVYHAIGADGPTDRKSLTEFQFPVIKP